jgi:hypothetical protein
MTGDGALPQTAGAHPASARQDGFVHGEYGGEDHHSRRAGTGLEERPSWSSTTPTTWIDAIRDTLEGAFFNKGEACTAASRFLVHRGGLRAILLGSSQRACVDSKSATDLTRQRHVGPPNHEAAAGPRAWGISVWRRKTIE